MHDHRSEPPPRPFLRFPVSPIPRFRVEPRFPKFPLPPACYKTLLTATSQQPFLSFLPPASLRRSVASSLSRLALCLYPLTPR